MPGRSGGPGIGGLRLGITPGAFAPRPARDREDPERPRPAPRPAPTRRGPPVTRTQTLRERTDALIAEIRQTERTMALGAFSIGTKLMELDRPEVLEEYGVRTLKEFIEEQVRLSYATAKRYMAIARNFDEETAQDLKVEKATQLIRLARVAPGRHRSPAALWRANPAYGTPPKRLRAMSAKEVEGVAKGFELREAAKQIPKPSDTQKQRLDRLSARVEETLGVKVKARLDLRKERIVMQLDLSELDRF